MDITISEKIEQPALQRTQYIVSCVYDNAPTPARAELHKQIAAKIKVAPEQLVVRKIDSHYGGNGATITAIAYKDAESLKTFEFEHVVKKNTPKAEEAKAE